MSGFLEKILNSGLLKANVCALIDHFPSFAVPPTVIFYPGPWQEEFGDFAALPSQGCLQAVQQGVKPLSLLIRRFPAEFSLQW